MQDLAYTTVGLASVKSTGQARDSQTRAEAAIQTRVSSSSGSLSVAHKACQPIG